MQLKRVQVTNFRSVEDSGIFEVTPSLCLVGKNEAGKSAILQALVGLNPHPTTPFAYNKERDYPRRYLGQYASRHKDQEAQVIWTEWKLSEPERNVVKEELGADALSKGPLVITRRYGDNEPQFSVSLNYEKVIEHLIKRADLSEEEAKPLMAAKTSDDLRKALEQLSPRTRGQEALLQKINDFPNKNALGIAKAKLAPLLPQFMYSSHFDRMNGDIRLDTLNAREAANNPPVPIGEHIFVNFLQLAGTSIDEIVASRTYESLNARCEAASAQITDELKEYWTQNPFLEMEVRVTKAEPGDPAPFNEGVVARARVKNNLHRLTLPFSERSAGFIWFFSFLVQFSQVKNTASGELVLLLDEPGLTLHATAQQDLLRYFTDKLVPFHQLIYSTHSPFMVPPDKLDTVLIVEDRVTSSRPGVWTSVGTKVRSDVMAVDRDTLFPLQGALGYEVTQSLFIGKHTLLVEGPGDILYLYAFSAALKKRGRTALDPRWSVCPAGGLDKIQAFVSLFSSAKLDIGVLTDFSKKDQRKIDALVQNNVLEASRILTVAGILGQAEADMEDVFDPALYASIVNSILNLKGANSLDAAKIVAETSDTRLVKKVEALCRVLPTGTPDFDHFSPADWLFRHPELLDAKDRSVDDTLDRAEKIIVAVNALLT